MICTWVMRMNTHGKLTNKLRDVLVSPLVLERDECHFSFIVDR